LPQIISSLLHSNYNPPFYDFVPPSHFLGET
jgi:hypothetical protein